MTEKQAGKFDYRIWTIIILLAGLVLRLGWLRVTESFGLYLPRGEATFIAFALAEQGQFADSFFPGQGPTAHLMPSMTLIAGGIYRLFGSQGFAPNALLTLITLMQTAAIYWLARRLFKQVGSSAGVLAGGLALLCLIPAYVVQELVDFRYWEGGLAVLLATFNLILIVEFNEGRTITRGRMVLAALLAGLTFFVSPPAGVGIYACWAWFCISRWGWLRAAGIGAGFGVALSAFILPWTLRNAAVMGEPILLRSNFGLELAIGNHQAAVSGENSERVMKARLKEVHPINNPAAVTRLKAAGGEIAYAKQLGAETEAWIAANPGDFARLLVRHYRQFYLPDTWEGQFTNWRPVANLRIHAIQIISLLGLIGLALGLWRRRRHYGMIALYMAVIGLPYALVQPIPRYSYLLWPLYAFFAAQLITDLVAMIRGSSGKAIERA